MIVEVTKPACRKYWAVSLRISDASVKLGEIKKYRTGFYDEEKPFLGTARSLGEMTERIAEYQMGAEVANMVPVYFSMREREV